MIPAVGFAAIVVVAGFLTLADATAELSVPAVVAIAIAGLAVGARRLRPLPSGWALLAAAGTYAVYAAPIVLSGKATFAGYIQLDDTATWMALTDRVMEHGRNLDGLAPSTYEATLAFNLADGYPVGAFLPLGVGRAIVGTDVAWLIQPYMACAGRGSLARRSGRSPGRWSSRRACARPRSFIAAQPALLFGYFLWGGIKEVVAAALIAAGAVLVGRLCAGRFGFRALIPVAVVAAGLAAVLSAGGLVWLLPGLVLALAVAARTLRPAALAGRAAALAAMLVALSIPVIAGGLLPPTSSPLTDASARGNLLGPLEPAQVAGIWPAGDFRVDPSAGLLVAALIAFAILLACVGLLRAWRRRSWGALAYVGGSLAAAAAIYAFGSPWVDAKALATASPAIPFAAMVGAAGAIAGGRRAGRRDRRRPGRSRRPVVERARLPRREPRPARSARRARADRRSDRRAGTDADDRVRALRSAPLPARRGSRGGSELRRRHGRDWSEAARCRRARPPTPTLSIRGRSRSTGRSSSVVLRRRADRRPPTA